MSTWISPSAHRRAAIGGPAGVGCLAFSCGNLAPDSGIPNGDWSAFDPPKEVTHFLRPGEDEGRIEDLVFYRKYLASVTPLPVPPGTASCLATSPIC